MQPLKQLFDAIEQGDARVVCQLVENDPTLLAQSLAHSKTPLHIAAEKNQLLIATYLVDKGAALEAETDWGMTPLQWGALLGSFSVACMLYGKGAKMNLASAAALGDLPLVQSFWTDERHLRADSAQRCGTEVAPERFQPGPVPTDYSEIMSHALYAACRNNQVGVAGWLHGHGADLNYRGAEGGTALHWAAVNGHLEAVRFLLDKRADTTLKDDEFNGYPIDWALHGGHQEIVRLLTPVSPAPTPGSG